MPHHDHHLPRRPHPSADPEPMLEKTPPGPMPRRPADAVDASGRTQAERDAAPSGQGSLADIVQTLYLLKDQLAQETDPEHAALRHSLDEVCHMAEALMQPHSDDADAAMDHERKGE